MLLYSSPHTPPHVDLGLEEPVGSQSCGAKAGLAPGLPHDFSASQVSPTSDPQILPQEEDYGFDIEERNKAVVVKSVQRGSLAEVRPLRGAVWVGE